MIRHLTSFLFSLIDSSASFFDPQATKVTATRKAIAPRKSFFIRNSCINIFFACLFYLKLVALSTFIKKLRQFFQALLKNFLIATITNTDM